MDFPSLTLFIALLAGSIASARADTVTIPLNGSGIPAADLVLGTQNSFRILSPQEALRLKRSGKVDLSELDPDATGDVWKQTPSPEDEALDELLPVKAGDTVQFQGFITSSPTRFRFNVQVQGDGTAPRTYTILLGRNVHSTLLRKGILRRLGYKVPPMKHLSRLNVVLPNSEVRDTAFPMALQRATERDLKRWIVDSPKGSDPLRITLQDVVIMEATPLYYNVAMSPPIELAPNGRIREAGLRIVRALGPIYGLANIPEDVNLAEWYVGHIEDDALVFDVPDQANFACALDDALWITRKISTLTREDIRAAVAEAHFPDFVGKVVVENLIARRDSLVDRLKIKAPSLAFDQKISDGKNLVKGRLADQDWQALGYGSYFAGKEQPSPLREIGWYAIAQIQSNVTANLLDKINQQLPALSTSDAINKHYEKAMEQFARNGTGQTLRFAAWPAPFYNGGLDISRDIVIGSYMGTSSDDGSTRLVQLADNFGLHFNAGFMIGFDGVPSTPLPIGLQGQVLGTASISVTHLKPVKSLRSAVTEPLKAEFVPWVFYGASQVFKTLSEAQGGGSQSPDEIKKKIAEELKQIDRFIGEDESLIITESLAANESFQANVQGPTRFSPAIGIEPAANQLLLRRIHFYRPKSTPNTLMVFKDGGSLAGTQLSMNGLIGQMPGFPVFQISAKDVAGTADTEVYRVNIDPDPQNNPAVYSNAAGLVSALRSGSLETIRASQTPTRISTHFRDDSGWRQFLYSVNRSLQADGIITVTLPNGVSDSFLSASDGRQSGGSYQSLFTQAVNYAIQHWKSSTTINIDTKAAPNPGQTYQGYSQTRDASLQARVADGFSEPFVKVQYRWEGWDISPEKIRALVDGLSARYGFQLYPEGFLQDISLLQLYAVGLSISLGSNALDRILSMSVDEKNALVAKYAALYRCDARDDGSEGSAPAQAPDHAHCTSLRKFEAGYAIEHPGTSGKIKSLASLFTVSYSLSQFADFVSSYWKKSSSPVLQGEAMLEVVSDLEQFASFEDLIRLSGGTDANGSPLNLYVQGSIAGFRVGSETLSEPIPSNGFGHQDPVGGPLDAAQRIMGTNEGELRAQWIRDHL